MNSKLAKRKTRTDRFGEVTGKLGARRNPYDR